MKLGVFTSPHLETAVSGIWAICLYCSDDKSVIGARLYRGTPEIKRWLQFASCITTVKNRICIRKT